MDRYRLWLREVVRCPLGPKHAQLVQHPSHSMQNPGDCSIHLNLKLDRLKTQLQVSYIEPSSHPVSGRFPPSSSSNRARW